MTKVRFEREEDLSEIRRVNELAFGQPNEADLVDALRIKAHPHISLVAVDGEEIVGHIFFSPVTVQSENDSLYGDGACAYGCFA
jgi:putative acetyltransferase